MSFGDEASGPRLLEALFASEQPLGAADRPEAVGNWEIVPSTGERWFSSGFSRLLGLPEDRQVSWPEITDRVHRDDHAVLKAAADECLQAGAARCEVRVSGPDGRGRVIAIQAERLEARDGAGVCVRGTILDVTVRRNAEAQRTDVAGLFRHGFDGSPIGMAVADAASGVYVRVNNALCRLLDRPREQLMGDSGAQITHPDDRQLDRRLFQEMLDGSRSSAEYEKRYLRPDGEVVWVALSAAPVHRRDGSVQAVFLQMIDITERKAHESRFEASVHDALWLGRIRDAIDEDRLMLYRQPIVDLRTGESVQQELLLRMRGEDGSVIAPGEFLPIAERYGLIAEIDRWVIRQAVGLAAAGQAVEFNVSGASIGDSGIVLELASEIERTGADPRLLVVEVTETAMMSQLDAGRRFAADLAAIGCGLALDDFGTGFSSLSYLKQIPADYLKIDIEFVRDLIRSETDERLVRGIIGIAREFDQTTVAEGIEDEATFVRLRELGVHYGQGYLFGRPEPLKVADRRVSPARSTPVAPVAPVTPGADRVSGDPVDLVRRVFVAFAVRDVDAIVQMCDPDVVLRPFQETSELTGRTAPYRGHAGIRDYMQDIAEVWQTLKLTPTAFRRADESVIVFGRAESNSGAGLNTVDLLWIWRLRAGLVASVEIFASLPHDPGGSARTRPLPQPQAGRGVRGRDTAGFGAPDTADAVRMADIIKTTDAAVVGMATDGRIVSWNPAAERLYGYAAEEALGRPAFFLIPPDRLGEVASNRTQINGGGTVGEIETVRRRKDGTDIDVAIALSPLLNDAGEVIGASTIARDITAEKAVRQQLSASEERLRATIDDAPIGIALLTLDGRPLRINRALCEMLGYAHEELLTRTLIDITHPDDVGLDVELSRRMLADEISSYELERRFLRADGSILHALMSVSLARRGDGEPMHLVSHVQDIGRRKQDEARLRIQAREQEVLTEVATLVASDANIRAVFAVAAQRIAELLDAGYGLVVRFENEAYARIVGAWPDHNIPARALGATLPLDRFTATTNAPRPGRLTPPAGDTLRTVGRAPAPEHELSEPIEVNGRSWGAVTVGWETAPTPDPDAAVRLSRIARLVTLAVTSADAREQLSRLASTDDLTGLVNRRAFTDRLEQDIAQARLRHRPLSLAVFDLDHFKLVNDTYGHPMGDRILAEFASRLTDQSRDGDTIARIGGEEFAWIMTDADGSVAELCAERARQAITSTPFPGVGKLTTSIGVCVLDDADSGQHLLRQADRALYRAKASGRNATMRYSAEAAGLLRSGRL